MGEHYKEIDGMSFTVDTPDEVCEALCRARYENKKVRIFTGNRTTGIVNLGSIHDIGFVDAGEGKYAIPVMKKTARAKPNSGIVIPDNLILRIMYATKTGKDLYRADNFQFMDMRVEGRRIMKKSNMMIDGVPVYTGLCAYDDIQTARKHLDFFMGRRHTLE